MSHICAEVVTEVILLPGPLPLSIAQNTQTQLGVDGTWQRSPEVGGTMAGVFVPGPLRNIPPRMRMLGPVVGPVSDVA